MKKKNVCLLGMVLLTVFFLSGCNGSAFVLPRMSTAEISADTSAASLDKSVDEYVRCGVQGNLELYVNPASTQFYVKDVQSGSTWYSTPENSQNDAFADGIYKMEMASNLIVSYVNTKTSETSRFNTNTGSTMDGNYSIAAITNGFSVDYTFPDYQITIPFRVYLDDGGVKAEVLTEKIQYGNPDVYLSSVAVLPYFGAGSDTDQGYLFVADGSGGLIHFNNGKYTARPYSRPIFGMDPTDMPEQYDLKISAEDILLPVFGVKRNNAAMVAIVENGAAQGTINAYTNKQQTSYANVYTEFSIQSQLDYSMGNIDAPVYEKPTDSIPCFGIRYCFLKPEDSDYNGMARYYRDYLEQNHSFKSTQDVTSACYIELYGGVTKTISRLGIQSDSIVPLTTTGQVAEIVDALKNLGVEDVVVNYHNWNKNELLGKSVDGASISGNLNKGAQKFDDLLARDDFLFYPSIDQSYSFSNVSFWKRTFETASDLSGVVVRMKKFAPGIGKQIGDPYYFITGSKLNESLMKMTEKLSKKMSRISLSDVGNTLYSDYRNETLKRENIQLILQSSLEAMNENFEHIMLNRPNSYAIPYADEIFGIPTVSSGQDLIDEDVPFYAMVLSGTVRYSCQPLNNSNVGDQAYLKAIENGSMIAYTWIYEDPSVIKNTSLSFLSSAHYTQWLETAAKQYQVTAEIDKVNGSGKIHSHNKMAKGVYCLTYENGACVYVNYGEADHTLEDGTVIPAGDCLIKEGK